MPFTTSGQATEQAQFLQPPKPTWGIPGEHRLCILRSAVGNKTQI